MTASTAYSAELFQRVIKHNVGQNSNPKTRVCKLSKPEFSGLKKLRVTRVFGFGLTRVENPSHYSTETAMLRVLSDAFTAAVTDGRTDGQTERRPDDGKDARSILLSRVKMMNFGPPTKKI